MPDSKQQLSQETETIIGCAFEVHNLLGLGLSEKLYEKALCVELTAKRIPFVQQPTYSVYYKNVEVGEFKPDLIVYNKVIVELKTIPQIGDLEVGQLLNYLRITKLKVGLILNFKNNKMEVKRMVL